MPALAKAVKEALTLTLTLFLTLTQLAVAVREAKAAERKAEIEAINSRKSADTAIRKKILLEELFQLLSMSSILYRDNYIEIPISRYLSLWDMNERYKQFLK